jgi:hypothetical protein
MTRAAYSPPSGPHQTRTAGRSSAVTSQEVPLAYGERYAGGIMNSSPPISNSISRTLDGERTTDPLDMLPMVAKAAKLSDSCHLTTFRGYRKDRSGRVCEVTIEVMDRGQGHPRRYAILAADDLGRMASGDGDGDLPKALATVRWYRLDKEPLSEPGWLGRVSSSR